jgi:hypothetical protein
MKMQLCYELSLLSESVEEAAGYKRETIRTREWFVHLWKLTSFCSFNSACSFNKNATLFSRTSVTGGTNDGDANSVDNMKLRTYMLLLPFSALLRSYPILFQPKIFTRLPSPTVSELTSTMRKRRTRT